jgi:hypothetical protein
MSALIVALVVWYGLGALGSEIGRRVLNAWIRKDHPRATDMTWLNDPFCALMALAGPANLLGTVGFAVCFGMQS